MNNLEQIPLDFTKTQKKWITRVCVALSLIYEMISLMSDFNTDYSDGFFILLPISLRQHKNCNFLFYSTIFIQNLFLHSSDSRAYNEQKSPRRGKRNYKHYTALKSRNNRIFCTRNSNNFSTNFNRNF